MRTVPSWDEYFANMLPSIADRSKDIHTQIGCVVVGPDNEIRTTGYNSLVRGMNDKVEERYERPLKYKYMEHAERNAFYNATRNGVCLNGCRLYISLCPCVDCARGIVQCGITEVILTEPMLSEHQIKRGTWMEDWKLALEILSECGVNFRCLK